MKIRSERDFNYSVDKAVTVFFESGDSYDMNELENVTQWKVVKEEDFGDRRVGTKEWCAHSQIPKALQPIINPKMLTWFEHSEWNRKTRVYSFTIEPHFLHKQVKCTGKTAYIDKGPNKSGRIFEMTLKVDIPIFGPMLENLVQGILKKNEEQDFILSAKSLDKVYGGK